MRAIVLQTIPTNDKGGVVKLFTEDHGVRAYYVNWGKKAMMYQAMTLLEVEERERRAGSMKMLADARREPVLHELTTHPFKAAVALFMAEVLSRSLADEQVHVALFTYCFLSVQALNLDDRVAAYPIVFLGKLIQYLGFTPPEPRSDEQGCFDLLHGEWSVTPPTHGQCLRGEEATLFKQAINASVEGFQTLTMNREQRASLLDQLLRYLQIHLHSDREIKSYAVLREVFR